MRGGWGLIVLLGAESVAWAQAVSPIAMGDRLMTGIEVQAVRGQTYDHTVIASHLRFGLASSAPITRWGGQLGFEGEGRVLWRSEDSGDGGFGTEGRLELALRTYTFNTPIQGALVVHAGGEIGFGRSRWRMNGGRIAPLVGIRWTGAVPDGRLEFDYTALPIWGRPGTAAAPIRGEHRLTVTLGTGPVGLGVSVDVLHRRLDGRTENDIAVGALIELRR